MLSGDEEVMAQKLVDVESEAVILHGGLKIDLLCRNKSIGDHKFLWRIFHDLVVIIEETCCESGRCLLLEVLPHLGLRSGENDGVKAS